MRTYQETLDELDGVYRELLKNGYKHHEIDVMDIFHFLSLYTKDKVKKDRKLVSPDDFFKTL